MEGDPEKRASQQNLCAECSGELLGSSVQTQRLLGSEGDPIGTAWRDDEQLRGSPEKNTKRLASLVNPGCLTNKDLRRGFSEGKVY